jgi:hypothetical protein
MLIRTNAEVQIPQVITVQMSEPYEIAFRIVSGMLLYSENGISVIAIENKKTLVDGENVKTYYVDFIASQLPPDAYVILIHPPPVIDTYVAYGMAPQGLQAILTVETPELENQLFTEDVVPGIKSATVEDILRQFAIWAYMGVDLASMKGYWLLLGLSEEAWAEAEGWLASFAKASPAKDLMKLDPSIEVSYEPQGYSTMVIQLTNGGIDDAYVRAEVGTILKNKNEANQNIAIGETGVVFLPTGLSKRMNLKSYCINAGKGAPTKADALIPTNETNFEVKHILASAAAPSNVGGRAYYQVHVQEAVWHVTDKTPVYSDEARALLVNDAEIQTWESIEALPWNPEISAGASSVVLILIISTLAAAIGCLLATARRMGI